MSIPNHCIQTFVDKFGIYPCFVQSEIELSSDVIKKLKDKSNLLWLNKLIDQEKNIDLEQLLEYDYKGIMIYIKDGSNLTFMCDSKKIQNVELLLSQLKRIKK